MATVACPFCYHKINQSRLAYRCLGRGVPGGKQTCTKQDNVQRQATIGVRELSYPTFEVEAKGLLGTPKEAACTTCGGITGRRACPVCHSPLSATFRTSRSPMVGVVGGKGAGKSVYLSVLYHELRTSVRRRFQADIGLAGDQQGSLGSAQDWLKDYEDQLFEHGKLLRGTESAPAGRRAPVVVEWRQPRRRLGVESLMTTVLSFYDAAGEDLSSDDRVHDQAYLGISDGLILLLDPWQLPHAAKRIEVPARAAGAAPPLQVLRKVTDQLRTSHGVPSKRLKVPVAVVFAKMDAFFPVLGSNHPLMSNPPALAGYDEVTGQDTHEHVKALLDEYGADDIDAHLAVSYTNYRYFAVSALGAPPDYGADTVNERGVQPFRVEEPLLWLLNRLGVLDRTRA
ncbi:MAG: zinc ribbon domain-containing protein [Pseudonocardia sp.]|nr:zinc ribbon domain-containing protein [Pseudonocardia sp.]